MTAIPLSAPAKPTGFSATAGDQQVTLKWDNANDIYITAWEYKQNSADWVKFSDRPGEISHTVEDLTNGDEYAFMIRATIINTGEDADKGSPGPGPASDEMRATPIPPPAKPTGFNAAAGDAEVTLTWTDPEDSTITSWQYQIDPGSWATITGSDADTISHNVTGLTNGTEYAFMIRAVNPRGAGPASEVLKATPIAVPEKPTGFSATAGNRQVTLNWDNPNNSTITSWQYQIDPGSWKPITPSGATTTSHTVKGLTNGTEYAFKIRAVNPRGPGEASDERKATPIPPPAKPTGLSATPGTQNVTLAWSDLTDPSVTEWQYQQNDGPGFGAWQEIRPSDASTTTHTVSGLLHTTEYAFKVRAVNLSGAGVPSDEARATPLPPTPTTASRPRARITTLSITSDAGADETYENGDIIEFTAQFSRSVRVIGLVQLAFEMGSETRQAAYTTGSSSSQLVFSYEVSDQDLDEDGIAIPAGSLELVAGATVLTVRGGRPATRTHRGLATAPAHKVDGRRVPVVTRLEVSSDPGADLIYTEGNLIELRVTFSDPVEVTGNPSIDLAVGDAARTAFYASGSGTRELLFSYQVLRQDRDDDGISVPAPVSWRFPP